MIAHILYITSILCFLFCNSAIAQDNESELPKGWIEFEFNLDYLYVVVDNNYEDRHKVKSGDSIQVSIGYKQLRLVNEVMDDVISYALVDEDETTYKFYNFRQFRRDANTSFQVLENGYNTTLTTETDGDLIVNGNYVGTGYAEVFLAPGKHQLIVRHPKEGEIKYSFSSDLTEITHINRFHGNPDDWGVLKLLPGGGYLSAKRYEHAIVTYSAFIGLGVLLSSNNSKYQREKSEYDEIYTNYQSTNNTLLAVQLRNELQSPKAKMQELNNTRTMILSGMAALYIATTIHGFMKPKSGYYSRKVNVSPTVDPISMSAAISLNLRFGGGK